MKKIALVVVALLMAAVPLFAQMGVNIINPPKEKPAVSSVDNLVVGEPVEIPDFAVFEVWDFEYNNNFWFYKKDVHDFKVLYNKQRSEAVYDVQNIARVYKESFSKIESGNDAAFALVRINITNLMMEPKDFTEIGSVKVVYDDKYELPGFMFQSNFDNLPFDDFKVPYSLDPKNIIYDFNHYTSDPNSPKVIEFVKPNKQKWVTEFGNVKYEKKHNKYFGIDKSDNFPIKPLFSGHYVLGCAIPNFANLGDKSLRMVLVVDGNEVSFNLR